jgi:hypothetical protein
MRHSRSLLVALSICTPFSALAADPPKAAASGTPAPYEKILGFCRADPDSLHTVLAYYKGGPDRWAATQEAAASLIKTCKFLSAPLTGSDTVVAKADWSLDLASHWVVLLLVDPDTVGGKPQLVPILVHDKPVPRPYELTVPGLGSGTEKLFELVVGSAPFTLKAAYSEQRDPDPVEQQAGAFGQQLLTATNLGSFQNLLGKSQAKALSATTKPHDFDAVLVEIDLSYKRSTLTAEHKIDGAGVPAGTDPLVTSYKNRPLRRFTFGALSGVRFAAGADGRAKVDSGNMQPDPLPLLVTMAIVNLHPWGYDEESPTLTKPPRPRLFVGVGLTPGFGVGGGYGFALVRGLSANVGVTSVFHQALRSGDSFGSPPKDPNKATSTRLGWAAFAGLSFNLK